jgi:hypothetical protein
MQKSNWNGRKRARTAMPRKRSGVAARLVHYELAGRSTIEGANGIPFLLRRREPATSGEQAALRLPDPRNPHARRDGSGGFAR